MKAFSLHLPRPGFKDVSDKKSNKGIGRCAAHNHGCVQNNPSFSIVLTGKAVVIILLRKVVVDIGLNI